MVRLANIEMLEVDFQQIPVVRIQIVTEVEFL
jgi:hypothetical protein